MSDQEKLREAIALVRDLFRARGWGVGTIGLVEAGKMVADAAESTLPKTAMVNVWRVEFVAGGHPKVLCFLSEKAAATCAESQRLDPSYYACIRVTGPHQQEVPA